MKPSRYHPTRLPCWPWLAVLLAAGMAGESRGTDAVAWQKLISQSPFLGAGQAASSAPVREVRLEFRGFYTMDGQTFFRVDDPTRNRGAWLVLGQPEDGILVKQHDPATETIIVESHGQTQTLTWRAGKIIN